MILGQENNEIIELIPQLIGTETFQIQHTHNNLCVVSFVWEGSSVSLLWNIYSEDIEEIYYGIAPTDLTVASMKSFVSEAVKSY